jgi:hypothetical protein
MHMSAPTIHQSTPDRLAAGEPAADESTGPSDPRCPAGDDPAGDESPAIWGSFVIDGATVGRGRIKLEQTSLKCFALHSAITYTGRTGLEGKVRASSIDAIRTVTPQQLDDTDLASVPTVLRWFVSPYGVHTPAALIHDRLIGLEPRIEEVTDQAADRYFRFMLDDLGVRFIQRWLMWAAVAFRTRFVAGGVARCSLVLWVVLSMIGIAALADGVLTGNWWLAAAALLAPWVLSALWGRQYGAGIVAAYFAVPWILPPTLFASVAYGTYRVAEWAFHRVGGPRADHAAAR